MPYPSSFDRPPTVMLTWQQRLGEARATEEVLWVVKDFIASWHPEELSSLPDDCRPGRLADPDDVAFYAFTLVREQRMTERYNPSLHRMATFFSAASHRISQIMALYHRERAASNRIGMN